MIWGFGLNWKIISLMLMVVAVQICVAAFVPAGRLGSLLSLWIGGVVGLSVLIMSAYECYRGNVQFGFALLVHAIIWFLLEAFSSAIVRWMPA